MEKVQINMSLDINAQRIISNYQMYSKELEEQIKEGINRGIEEMKNIDIPETVKNVFINQVKLLLEDKLFDYHFRQKLSNMVDVYVEQELKNMAATIGKNLLANLQKLQAENKLL